MCIHALLLAIYAPVLNALLLLIVDLYFSLEIIDSQGTNNETL